MLVAPVGLGACAHANGLDGRIQGLNEILDQAEQSGARTCAPRELATARANLRFGWDTSGVAIPGLLCLGWFAPVRLLSTVCEALLIERASVDC